MRRLVGYGLAAALAMGACAEDELPPLDDEDDTGTGTSIAGGRGGDGGSDTTVTNTSLCDRDCSLINVEDPCRQSVCNEGEFPGPIGFCTVVPNDDGIACDDGEFCTIEDSCLDGVCVGGRQNDCGLTPEDCEAVSCNENTEACELVDGEDGVACGNLCETGGTCSLGTCVGTTVRFCGDESIPAGAPPECYAASCNPATGDCEAFPANDGATCRLATDFCQVGGTCNNGVCENTSAADCSQFDMGCDIGVCDPLTGFCGLEPGPPGITCDDGDACTTGETCDMSGVCGSGNPVACVAGDGCCPSGCDGVNDPDTDCLCNPSDILIEEVSTGGPDYVVLRNYCTFLGSTRNLTLGVDDATTRFMDLPDILMQPNEAVLFYESGGNPSVLMNPPTQTILLSFTMGFQGTGGWAVLCDNTVQATCDLTNGTNVTDYVAWNGASDQPAGVSIMPAVTGVSSTNLSVIRQATGGSPPNFLGTDWAAAPETY